MINNINLDGTEKSLTFAKPMLAEVNSSETFEDYYKQQIKEGLISENGKPLKCECGCKEFISVNEYHGEGWIEEYSLECTNQECFKIVGHWAFGNWQV